MPAPQYDARPAKREYKTQRSIDANRSNAEVAYKALNEKTRIEIALIKYLEKKGVPVHEVKDALQSVKTAQEDVHFKLLWDLLDKPYDA